MEIQLNLNKRSKIVFGVAVIKTLCLSVSVSLYYVLFKF